MPPCSTPKHSRRSWPPATSPRRCSGSPCRSPPRQSGAPGPGAARDDVLVTWTQLVALHRQWHSLTRELKDAEQALGQDASEANYLRLRDVKARLSRMEGTEAQIEGFGASSGRGVRSL